MANGPFMWDFSGLFDSPGLFARPGASATSIENMRISKKGLLEKRLGFERLPEEAQGPIWAAFTSRLLNDNIFIHVGDAAEGVYLAKTDGTVAPTALTNVDGQDVTRGGNPRLHMAAAQTAHYFTSRQGVRRVESDFNQVRTAGMPAGLAPDTMNNLVLGETASVAGGTATGALTASAGPVYTDGGQSWVTDDLIGKFLVMTSGAAAGRAALITSNTSTAVTCATSFVPAPAPADTYAIQNVFRQLQPKIAAPIPDGGAVAYRVTWHRRAQDGITILGGPPTGRTVIRNIAGVSGYDAGQAYAVLRIPVPCEFNTPYGFATGGISPAPNPPAFAAPPSATAGQLTEEYFFRLWRTLSVAAGTPNDECYQVAEAYLTTEDIARGYCIFEDQTPDSFLSGAPTLHTNAIDFPEIEANIQNGIVNADNPPPAAVDAALFADSVWYANTTERARKVIKLLAYGAQGFNVGDTFYINNIQMVGVAQTAPPTPPWSTNAVNTAIGEYEFQISTGLATLALNIEATARNLIEQFNRCQRGEPIYGYYISLGTQQPGSLLFEMNAFEYPSLIDGQPASSFNLQSDHGRAWEPPLETSVQIDKEEKTNQLFFSKASRPDAVAPINFFNVGPSDSRILRITAFRDRLYVFTDNGLYQVTGDFFGNYALQLVDGTARLFSPESLALVDDAVYAWLVEGIAEINEAGVTIISTPIETKLQDIANYQDPQKVIDYSFAIGYRVAHRVQFFYLNGEGGIDTGPFCVRWLEFDVRTRTWSTGLFNNAENITPLAQGKSFGVVRFSDDRLILTTWSTSGGDNWLFLETPDVYADEGVDGVKILMSTGAEFQLRIPDTEGAVHWQQMVLHFNNIPGDAYIQWPGFLTMSFSSKEDSAITSQVINAIAPGSPIARFETPLSLRRNSRLSVFVGNTTDTYWGLIGLQMTYREGTRFAIKTGGFT